MKIANGRVDIKSLFLGAIVGACIVVAAAAATSSNSATTWEYKIVVGKNGMNAADLEQALNKATTEGWVFVTTSSYSEGMPLVVLKKERK